MPARADVQTAPPNITPCMAHAKALCSAAQAQRMHSAAQHSTAHQVVFSYSRSEKGPYWRSCGAKWGRQGRRQGGETYCCSVATDSLSMAQGRGFAELPSADHRLLPQLRSPAASSRADALEGLGGCSQS